MSLLQFGQLLNLNESPLVRHYIAHLSLIHGWLPAAVQAVSVCLLALAVGWRSYRWRTVWVPCCLIAGVVFAFAAHEYIASFGIAGDPAPRGLWVWAAMTGAAATVLIVGWPAARWWRRGASLLAAPMCLLCVGLSMNLWVGYFPTVRSAWNQLTARPLPNQTDRITVTAMQLAGTRPAKGVVVPVVIASDVSKFKHRRELVYLPPAWFAANPPPRLPTVMMIGSALNMPADWLRAGNAVQTIDDFASAHGGYAPVLVFPDATGAFDNDTECVNGPRGNAADHLVKEVVPYMVSNFGVSADRANWGILGWSMGGTCALDLTVMHPDMFSAFVDIAGDLGPNTGSKNQTIAQLFGGDANAWAAYDPATVIRKHGRYTGVSARFDVPGADATSHDALGNPEGQDVVAHALCDLTTAQGIGCSVVAQPGKHDWPFAAQAFAVQLPWLAAKLGISSVGDTPLSSPDLHAQGTR
jgi:S-formylglutathione hydrolase FrmB